jgi:antitoxin (DNA-binding transcriptional repressor) of toxin-antitoxin stability system
MSYIDDDHENSQCPVRVNHEFSDLLSRVERGEETLITKRSKPVAVLSPYRPPLMTPAREKAVQSTRSMCDGAGTALGRHLAKV